MTPWTVACQAPLSMEFPRQEYWRGLPIPSLWDLPEPRIEPASPALAGRFFTTETPGKPYLSTSIERATPRSNDNVNYELGQCRSIDCNKCRGLPGGPVVKTSPSSAGVVSLIPGQGDKIPHALWPKKPKHKTEAIV